MEIENLTKEIRALAFREKRSKNPQPGSSQLV